MGFDDMFENHKKHHNYERRDDHNYYERRYMNEDTHPGHDYDVTTYLRELINKIRSNKKLQIIVGVLGILLLAIIIALLAILIPLVLKLLNYISQQGIQGVIDGISSFFDKIWRGAGK